MIKKLLCTILALLLICGLMGSCGQRAEEGEIEDVEIAEPSYDTEAAGKFIKAESPHDYEYTSFAIKKAHMRFDVPKTWVVTFVNARYVTIQTPKNDAFLPDTTISILCGYGEDIAENEMTQYTLNDRAYKFSDFFSFELAGLTTYTDGIPRHLRSYTAEDEIRNGLSIVDEEHKSDAATLIADNVVLVDKTNKHYIDQYGMTATYVSWDGSPFCFTAIAAKENLENATQMIEYMVSSIAYEKSKAVGYKEISYEDFATCVPSTFARVSNAENIYISPLTENTETAGMAVGVFTMDKKNWDTLEADTIATKYSETIASLCFSPYKINALYGIQVNETNNMEGPDFSGSVILDCTNYKDPTEIAGSVFGTYGYYQADYYVTNLDDRPYLITVIYQDCQKDLAKAFGITAYRKLRED